MRQTKALIESQGYDVIYGDTDSTFVWLKRTAEDEAAQIGARWSLSSTTGGAKLCKKSG
jgi:DNA polymerase-2